MDAGSFHSGMSYQPVPWLSRGWREDSPLAFGLVTATGLNCPDLGHLSCPSVSSPSSPAHSCESACRGAVCRSQLRISSSSVGSRLSWARNLGFRLAWTMQNVRPWSRLPQLTGLATGMAISSPLFPRLVLSYALVPITLLSSGPWEISLPH